MARSILCYCKGVILFALYWIGFSYISKAGDFSFIQNRGQWQSFIQFKANLPGGAVFFTQDRLVFSYYDIAEVNRLHELRHDDPEYVYSNETVKGHAYALQLLGSNKNCAIEGLEKQSAYHNYFIGNDPEKWAAKVPLYNGVFYHNVYNGIDLQLYGQDHNFKYDFIVRKGANPAQICLNFEGVAVKLAANGDLVVTSSVNEVRELAPYAYQLKDGQKRAVKCNFKLKGSRLTYEFPDAYDLNKDLIIDPVLVFKTYSASTAMTFGWSATYDNAGNLYSGGECFGQGWPVTLGAFQQLYTGTIDASINVYTPNGTALIYSTYYGGNSSDYPNSLIVDPTTNELIIFGTSSSTDLPMLVNSYNANNTGVQDLYLARFNSNGTALMGATYIGGTSSDGVSNHYVNIDNNGNILLASQTSSTDFPVTPGAYQSTYSGSTDGVYLSVLPNCSALNFSSYIGTVGVDNCKAIAQNNNGDILICGATNSATFPTTAGTLHSSYVGGTNDGFLCKFSANGNSLLQSTFVGTPQSEFLYRMQIDASDNIYVMGAQSGAATYPTTAGVYSNAFGNVFIDKIDPSLSTSLMSTKIGSINLPVSNLVPCAFLLDNCGHLYASFFSASSNLPLTTNAIQSATSSLWLFQLDGNMSSLLFATYMGVNGDHIDGGSSRFDPSGKIYQSVCTNSATAYANFPGAFSPTKQSGSWDIASFKIDFQSSAIGASFGVASNKDTFCAPDNIQFNNTSNALNYIWYFGDGSSDTTTSPTHLYTDSGTYTVMLVAISANSCNPYDTAYKTIVALPKPNIVVSNDTTCVNSGKQLNCSVQPSNYIYQYSWAPSTFLNTNNIPNPTVQFPQNSVIYTITAAQQLLPSCSSTQTLSLHVLSGFNVNPKISNICYNDTVSVIGSGSNLYNYAWTPTSGVLQPNALSTWIAPGDSGSYTYTVTASYPGCPDSVQSIYIQAQPQGNVLISNDTTICGGDTLPIAVQISPAYNYGYSWSPSAYLFNPNSLHPTFWGDSSMTIYFTLGTIPGCQTFDSIQINVNHNDVFYQSADTSICYGDSITIGNTIKGFTFLPLQNVFFNSDSSLITLYPTNSTIYTITTNEKCFDNNKFEFNLSVVLPPVAEFAISPEFPTISNLSISGLNASSGAATYSWYANNTLMSNNANITIMNPGEGTACLTLFAYNNIGCWDSITHCKKILGLNTLIVPNAFSPNMDGKNDVFKVLSKVPVELEMKIYNRFGNEVANLTSSQEEWDGNYKNKACETGIYYYFLKYTDNNGEEQLMKGDINLIR